MRLTTIAWVLLAASPTGCERTEDGPPVEPEPVPASSYRSETVDAMLDDTTRTLRTRGYAAEGDVLRGFVVEEATSVHESMLDEGACYAVIAAATAGVHELDLTLYDSDGQESARDTLSGGAAALVFCPATSGSHYFVVRAATGSGLFAVQLFRGPTGLGLTAADLAATLHEPAP